MNESGSIAGVHDFTPGVRVGRSRGRGLGLFTTRAFEEGERIYWSPFWLAPFDTLFEIETDLGCSTLTADDLGVELTLDVMEDFPDHVLDALARHYGLRDPDLLELREHVTEGRENEVLVSSYDGLVNHADEANMTIDEESMTVEFDERGPVLHGWAVALQPLPAGAELFWDYSEGGDFITPREWIA